MTTLTLEQKREKRAALIARASARFDAAGDKPLSEEEWSAFQAERKELGDLGAEIAAEEQRQREEAEAREEIRRLSAAMGAEHRRVESGISQGRTLGEIFARSEQYQRMMAQYAVRGRIPDSAKGVRSEPVNIPASAEMMRALLAGATLLTGNSSTSGGAFVINDRTDIYVPVAQRPLTLVDLITVSSTDSDTVEWVRQTARTNNAAAVAEATSTSDGEKPESAMTFEVASVSVQTIAHWIPATKRALSDVGQLRTIIDQELRYGLNEELEDQIMNGDGSAPDFTGMFNTSNIQTQAYSTDLFTTTRKALTKMETVAYEAPNGWIFNPTDWETFELLKDAEDRYYFGGPFATGPRTLWGYPVAKCHAMLAGHAFLGNFARCYLWMREGITITVTDSHSDFFVRNIVAILAEFRAAFGVTKPNALVKLSLSADS